RPSYSGGMVSGVPSLKSSEPLPFARNVSPPKAIALKGHFTPSPPPRIVEDHCAPQSLNSLALPCSAQALSRVASLAGNRDGVKSPTAGKAWPAVSSVATNHHPSRPVTLNSCELPSSKSSSQTLVEGTAPAQGPESTSGGASESGVCLAAIAAPS